MGGKLGGIGEGLGIHLRQPRNQGLSISSSEQRFGVLRAQVIRYGPCIRSFIESGFLKADRESANRTAAVGLEQSSDQRRIDST